jgi:nucleotide-binding universal stress UspA family protein
MKILVAVDGSKYSLKAVDSLVEHANWYREKPQVELVTVHLPLPKVPNMGAFVSKEMIQKYYDDECAEMLAPSRQLLDAAAAKYAVHQRVGQIAETIVEHATQSGADMIYMGTRGRSALASMALGSVATRVLHLAHVPVVLIH